MKPIEMKKDQDEGDRHADGDDERGQVVREVLEPEGEDRHAGSSSRGTTVEAGKC
jgi:hypothetical protein